MQRKKFEVSKLKGSLGKIRDWLIEHHMPPKLIFIAMGIGSTLWFLIRVIPKPTRAAYPCMQVAAPFMSGFVTYLLTVGGIVAISRRLNRKVNARIPATIMLLASVVIVMAISPSDNTLPNFQTGNVKMGPDDGPNQPIGEAKGIYPGRVVWVWNPDATNENFEHNDFENYKWFVDPENNNPEVIAKMFQDGILNLAGKETIKDSWDAIFEFYNENRTGVKRTYKKGEKIFIKINQGQSRWQLSQKDKDEGYKIPRVVEDDARGRIKNSLIPTETGPYMVLEMLNELVNEVGVDQSDIYLGDPMCPIWAHNYDVWVEAFPEVKYIDRVSENFGRTLISYTEDTLVYYSDKKTADKLYSVNVEADYMITSTNLKSHGAAGISLTAKSNFGNIGRRTAGHLHYSHIANRREGQPMNTGYGKYRVFVDLMGSKYLGQKNLIYIVEGLFGGGSNETKGPVKYFMPPFNNDWTNSIFMSLDPVAIESVGYDFLREEWSGKHVHDDVNNEWEEMANVNGVDDYMHQAADPANWPEGIIYDPDNTGTPVPVLGVHEHWNNPIDKQYTRNLGTGDGIELVSIPETLVKGAKN